MACDPTRRRSNADKPTSAKQFDQTPRPDNMLRPLARLLLAIASRRQAAQHEASQTTKKRNRYPR